MMHWARWSATVAVAALVAAPLCGQGSGGAADPYLVAPPHAVVTNDMLLNAANGRYYEPAPGRNMYVGFSLGAGE